mmetsp:Transcript_8928/g.18892  ORF Transcript_8928/g.18892 Transcript_8928/m.18892 type:complete len:238 (-) Transcript_8928:131-844(-)
MIRSRKRRMKICWQIHVVLVSTRIVQMYRLVLSSGCRILPYTVNFHAPLHGFIPLFLCIHRGSFELTTIIVHLRVTLILYLGYRWRRLTRRLQRTARQRARSRSDERRRTPAIARMTRLTARRARRRFQNSNSRLQSRGSADLAEFADADVGVGLESFGGGRSFFDFEEEGGGEETVGVVVGGGHAGGVSSSPTARQKRCAGSSQGGTRRCWRRRRDVRHGFYFFRNIIVASRHLVA